MNTLIIRHTPETNPPKFQVEETGTYSGTTSQSTELPSPFAFNSDIPNMSLMQGLQWYLENFLAYPFHPDTEKAEKIQESLERWGTQIFDALFDNRDAGMMYGRAIAHGVKELQLQISRNPTKTERRVGEECWGISGGVILGLVGCLNR